MILSSFIKAIHKLSNKGMLEAGVTTSYLDNKMNVFTITQLYIDPFTPNVSGTVNGLLLQPYFNWTHIRVQFKYWHALCNL